MGFPVGSDGKESTCNVGDLGLIPGLGLFPGEAEGYPFQYSGLENSMDRAAWQAIIQGVKKSWTQLSILAHKEFKSNLLISIFKGSTLILSHPFD